MGLNFRRRVVYTILTVACLMGWAWANPTGAKPGSKLPVPVYYSLPPAQAQVLQGFLAEYQETHPYLDIQGKNFATADALYQTLTKPGANPPALALMETSWLPHVAATGALLPVETWMSREQFPFNWSVKCNCYLPLWQASHVNNQLMAIPYFFTTRALIYNTEIFTKAGLKFPPATWEQLTQSALKMSDLTHNQYGFALSPETSPREAARSVQMLAWQTGGELLTPTGDSGLSAERALALVSELQRSQAMADVDKPTAPENVGMFIGTVEDYLKLRARGIPVKTAVVPGPDKASRTTELQAWAWGVFKAVPNDQMYKVQELGFFLLDFPQQRRWAEQTPYLAAHVKVFDNPFYRRERLADHAPLRVFLNSLGKSRQVDTAGAALQQLEAFGKKMPAVLRGSLNGGPVGVQP